VRAGLNNGEARTLLAGAVFFNRLGKIWDRSFERPAQSRPLAQQRQGR